MTKFKIFFLINPSLEFVHECIMAIFPKTLSDKFAMPVFHTCRKDRNLCTWDKGKLNFIYSSPVEF